MSRPIRRRLRGALLLTLVGAAWTLQGCATTLYDQGRAALDRGEPETAVTLFDQALDAGVRSYEAQRERGAARLAAGEPEKALEDLEAVRKQRPLDPRLVWLLGQAYSQNQRYEEAADAYRAYENLTRQRSAQEAARLRVAQLEEEIAENAALQLLNARSNGVEPEPNTVAVFAFQPEGGPDASLRDQKLCRALNIWVSADLAKVAGVRSIAVDQLDRIYAEQNFTYENRQFFDPASLVATGNLQPARYMVRGSFGSLAEDRAALGAACYDATMRSSDACSEQTGDPKNLFDMETQLVIDILTSVGVEPTAEERVAIGVKPTRNLQAFLAFADGVYLRDLGQHEAAAAAFSQAASIDPGFTMAAQYAAKATVSANPRNLVMVPAPKQSSAAEDRAMRSAVQLGLGLIPEGDGGDGGTTDLISVRGQASLRIDGRAGGNGGQQ